MVYSISIVSLKDMATVTNITESSRISKVLLSLIYCLSTCLADMFEWRLLERKRRQNLFISLGSSDAFNQLASHQGRVFTKSPTNKIISSDFNPITSNETLGSDAPKNVSHSITSWPNFNNISSYSFRAYVAGLRSLYH